MGSFNTKGWLSHLQMSYGEDIFAMICIGKAQHTKNMDRHNGEPGFSYTPYGELTPVCLPFFGKYDSYGRIEHIQRTNAVKDIEDFFGFDIDTIVDTLTDVTTIFRCNGNFDESNQTLDRYESMRDKLGLNDGYTNGYSSNTDCNIHICLVIDYTSVYQAGYSQFIDKTERGLINDRKTFSTDPKVTNKWGKYYIKKYGDESKFGKYSNYYQNVPKFLHRDKIGMSGFLKYGYGKWPDILQMYINPLQARNDGSHINMYLGLSEYSYDIPKKNMEKLLYNENLTDDLIKFGSFMWFLYNAYISISGSIIAGQDEINKEVIDFHKKVSEISLYMY